MIRVQHQAGCDAKNCNKTKVYYPTVGGNEAPIPKGWSYRHNEGGVLAFCPAHAAQAEDGNEEPDPVVTETGQPDPVKVSAALAEEKDAGNAPSD